VSLVESPAVRRAAALAILGALVALLWLGPLGSYAELVGSNAAALDDEAAILQRYRALTGAAPADAHLSGPSLLYAEMAVAQASALLQETVKNAAAAAHVQIQGLQMLRSETLPGATRFGLRVRASGDIAALRGLIYAIETARPLLVADNLSIQSRAATPTAAAAPLEFQFDVTGFKAEAGS